MTSYVILEKNSSEISPVWKSVHIILYFICAVINLMMTDCMGNIWSEFDRECILNSQLAFKPLNNSQELSCNVDTVQTKWSKSYSDCNAHFIVYLLLFCLSVIMLTFFIFLNIGSHSVDSQATGSWRVLWIATLINLVCLIVAIWDTKTIVKSVHTLCAYFPDYNDPFKLFRCSTHCLVFNEGDKSFLSSSLNILSIAPWWNAVFWCFNFGWCMLRIIVHPDFSIYKIVKKADIELKEGATSRQVSESTPVIHSENPGQSRP